MTTENGSFSVKKGPNNKYVDYKNQVYDIKWEMIDKSRYFPLTIINMFTVRSVLYPLTLVRTRLQVQTRGSLYTGTYNALTTVIKYEGFGALYKGFLVNSFQLFPHVLYITSYEKTRQQISLFTQNRYLTAFIGGASGSVIAQILSVPIDIVSQHMMLAGQKGANYNNNKSSIKVSGPTMNGSSAKVSKLRDLDRIHIPDKLKTASHFTIAKYVSQEIYKYEKIKGFYRGYFLSTFLVSLNSALWWPFYYFYQAQLRPFMPNDFPVLLLQCICGPLGSLSANLLTNPLDCMRTRMQVTRKKETSIQVLRNLWEQDGYRLFYRGLTARLSYSCLYSILITLGYETAKKYSLKEEYQQILYPIE
ncbi:unnamed protein product [Brachionus calyciflorus]|uniref:Solute carrier family 25 member 44 n=1 Tax=Brachionus calyciflorus TaxID=104777 RepID=A0A813S495_9BILA|nr:unnamed protein product [Brachionus calyciflorus]